jgi:hypothetical protein
MLQEEVLDFGAGVYSSKGRPEYDGFRARPFRNVAARITT